MAPWKRINTKYGCCSKNCAIESIKEEKIAIRFTRLFKKNKIFVMDLRTPNLENTLVLSTRSLIYNQGRSNTDCAGCYPSFYLKSITHGFTNRWVGYDLHDSQYCLACGLSRISLMLLGAGYILLGRYVW